MYEVVIPKLIKILLIILFFFLVFYLIYHFVSAHFEEQEHLQHVRNEEAVRSVEVLQGSTKNILTRTGDYYIISFELPEEKGFRIENLYIKFEYWDWQSREFVVSLYCNEQPYDTIDKYFLGEGTSYSFSFSCPDWTTVNYFTVTIKPLLIRKEVRWLNQETTHDLHAPRPGEIDWKVIISPWLGTIDVETKGALNRNPVTYDMILSVDVKVYKQQLTNTTK